MRVADNMNFRSFLRNLNDIRERIFEKNEQVSSGKRLNRPSQDPAASSQILRIREEVSRINQYFRNIQRGKLVLSSTEDVLNSVRNLVLSSTQKATQGLNDTLSQKERDAIADELDTVVEEMVRLSQTMVDGKRIFSGSQVDTDPLQLVSGSYVYQGDSSVLQVEVAQNQKVEITIPASEVFTEAGTDLVNTVKQLADAFRAGDTALAAQLTEKLEAGAEVVDTVRIRVAQRLTELESTRSRLDNQLLALRERASRLEDADIAEAISSLAQSETALRATLTLGARLRQPTLFDMFF